MSNFNKILDFIENTFSIKIKYYIKKDMSKYIYPTLAIQRDKGIIIFSRYAIDLCKLGFNSTFYFYFYYILLVILGKKNCDKVVIFIKQKLKQTPKL